MKKKKRIGFWRGERNCNSDVMEWEAARTRNRQDFLLQHPPVTGPLLTFQARPGTGIELTGGGWILLWIWIPIRSGYILNSNTTLNFIFSDIDFSVEFSCLGDQDRHACEWFDQEVQTNKGHKYNENDFFLVYLL